MKKIIICLLCFLLVGCVINKNSPTDVVEDLYTSYQNLDTSVLRELEGFVQKEIYMNEQEKDIYRSLLKKQYQNLSFKIVNEEVLEDMAVVDTEIEVLDYSSSILRSKKYYLEHQEEFSDVVVDQNNIFTRSEYIDYMLQELGKVQSKMKYGITFSLHYKNDSWEIEKIYDLDIQKIQGLYS